MTQRHYTPGLLIIGGLLLGALIGALAGFVPVGAAAGLALGAGADSWLNDGFRPSRAASAGEENES